MAELVNFKTREGSILIDIKDGKFIFADEKIDIRITLKILIGDTLYAISDKLAEDGKKVLYHHASNHYMARCLLDNKNAIEEKPQRCYPYRFDRNYGADGNLKMFQKIFDETYKGKKDGVKPIKHTVGVEYETCNGVIPSGLCFRYGLIPLRDGSITGNEYASVVMNSDNISAVFDQVKALSRYTNYDKDCAIHIHFGNIPLSVNFMYVLNVLLITIEDEIKNISYEHVYNTERYKSSGKSYCGRLTLTDDAMSMYEYFSMGMPYFGSMLEDHPADPQGEHKWNIKTRYKWCNFINAMFYRRGKTIEFRHLRPTNNPYLIYNNIHLYSAIIECAEKMYEEIKTKGIGDGELTKEDVYGIIAKKGVGKLKGVVKFVGRDYLVKFVDELIAASKRRKDKEDYTHETSAPDSLIKSF